MQAAIISAGRNVSTSNASQKATPPAVAPARVAPARLSSLGRRYVSEAVAAILDELREKTEGGRNHSLNAAAFAMGQFVGAGALDADDARDDLSAVAAEIGLEADEIAATVASGLRSGIAQPRKLDAKHIRRDAGDGDAILDPWEASAITPAPRFLKNVLPSSLEKYARQAARIRGADEDAACALALLAMGSACPADVLFMPRNTSWEQCVAFFVGLVGPPGASKSPLLDAAFWPLRDFDAGQHKAFLAATERAKAGQRDAKAGGADVGGLALPKRRQRHLTGATLEGARRVVHDTRDGVILLADELQTFFGSFDRYTPGAGGLGGSDRASWLSAFDGKTDAIARSDAERPF